jgi:hypothetical protein
VLYGSSADQRPAYVVREGVDEVIEKARLFASPVTALAHRLELEQRQAMRGG